MHAIIFHPRTSWSQSLSELNVALALEFELSPRESAEAIGELGASFLAEHMLQEQAAREIISAVALAHDVVSPRA